MIKIGDTVKIWKINSHQDLVSEIAEILNMPRGIGDLIQVKHKDGMVEAFNPYSPMFDSMTTFEGDQ